MPKRSTLQEIQPGDQLRARGDRSADGSELTAEEIVTGAFRNVAGLVNSVDASAGTITVQDLLSKKPVRGKDHFGIAAPQTAPGDGAAYRDAVESTMPPGNAGSGRFLQFRICACRRKRRAIRSLRLAERIQVEAEPVVEACGRGGAPDFQQMLSRMPRGYDRRSA